MKSTPWRLNQPLKQVSNSTAQIKDWNTPVNEVIQWKSKDGAMIEGVLLKPKNYDPKKKYPFAGSHSWRPNRY